MVVVVRCRVDDSSKPGDDANMPGIIGSMENHGEVQSHGFGPQHLRVVDVRAGFVARQLIQRKVNVRFSP